MTDTTWTRPSPDEVKRFVLRVIETNPERHDQTHWVSNEFEEISELDAKEALKYAFEPLPETPENPDQPYCGSTGCVAGWAVAYGSEPGTLLVANHMISAYYAQLPDGDRWSTSKLAQELMGLNSHQADWLFEEYRTRDEVIDALNQLLNDPDADISGQDVQQHTVTVTNPDGSQSSVVVSTTSDERDDYNHDNSLFGHILYKAYGQV